MDTNVPNASPLNRGDNNKNSVRSVRSFAGSDSSEATLVDLSPPSSPGSKDYQKETHSVSPPCSVALSSSPDAEQAFSALSRSSSVESISVKTWTLRDLAVDITPLYGDKPPIPIGAHLFKTAGGSASKIPVALDTFYSLLKRPGAVWANRIPFVHSLYTTDDYEPKLSLVRRPSGFGQRLFATMAPFAYSVHSKKVFTRFFGSSPSLETESLTLFIDMAKAFAQPAHDLDSAMNTYMNGVLKGFLRSHTTKLDLSFEEIEEIPLNGISSAIFLWIMECVALAGYRLIVTVDDFNLPLINSTPENIEDIADAISYHVVRPIAAGLQDHIIVGGMIFGNPASEEPLWVRESVGAGGLFNRIARDISDESCVHGAFGYTWDEVTALADELLPAEMRTQCLGAIESSCAKYRDPSGRYVEYSVDDVLTALREQNGLPARFPTPEPFRYYGSDDED